MAVVRHLCKRQGCGKPFELTHPAKQYCTERCQRADANARYRKNRTETAICPCGASFVRCVTTKRLKRFCTLACQYEMRSAEYRTRPDIQATLKRANRIRRRRAKGQPDERTAIFL
jgi:hypothetical protein